MDSYVAIGVVSPACGREELDQVWSRPPPVMVAAVVVDPRGGVLSVAMRKSPLVAVEKSPLVAM
jgi:hypothetical protein